MGAGLRQTLGYDAEGDSPGAYRMLVGFDFAAAAFGSRPSVS